MLPGLWKLAIKCDTGGGYDDTPSKYARLSTPDLIESLRYAPQQESKFTIHGRWNLNYETV